jgi:hypothetical protein
LRASIDDQKKLINLWHQYAGRTIELTQNSDEESGRLADILYTLITKAGLTVKQVPWLKDSQFLGVWLWSANAADAELMKVFECSLDAAGIFVMPTAQGSFAAEFACKRNPASPMCALRLTVGSKPNLLTYEDIRKMGCK